MIPAYDRWEIWRGADWSIPFELTLQDDEGNPLDWDLSGCSAECQIRKKRELDSTLIAEPSIAIDTDESTLTLALASTITAAIEPDAGFAEIFWIDSLGERKPMIYADVIFLGSATVES